MSVKVQIVEWEARGLRCPDHKISFENSDGGIIPITLIQMPNGTGKTTTLELLRSALSGSAVTWNTSQVREFIKKSDPSKSGYFKVSLRIDTHKLTFDMKFNFDEGSVKYFTTYYKPGYSKGFNPPAALAKIFHPSFVNYFVFDGELANQLLDHNQTNAQDVIEQLFQLNMFMLMKDRVDDYWNNETKDIGAREQTGHTRVCGVRPIRFI